MTGSNTQPQYTLYYWPLPFRGAFVSYLFAYADVPLEEIDDFDTIRRLMSTPAQAQDVPFLGPPLLRNHSTERVISQMPAIVLSVAAELELMPEDPFDQAMSMKILMDCNDILMEICRYNGSSMWTRSEWIDFRNQRLPRWLQILEVCFERNLFGKEPLSFADIGVFALLGNMTRCLPQLDADVRKHAPGVHALCASIGKVPAMARYVSQQTQRYGDTYCGGQIEQSIRDMLALDT